MNKFLSAALALVFALSLLPVTGTGGAAAAPSPSVIIHQAYGAGASMDGAVSHSFIELFNPGDSAVSMDGWSIQAANGLEGWSVLPLTGKSIQARSSFLIVGAKYINTGETVRPRYVIPSWDMAWDIEISNRAFSVALVSGQKALSPVITAGEKASVIGLLGAVNNPDAGDAVNNYTGSPLAGISKQRAARRALDKYLGGEDNNADYLILDYRETGIDDQKLAEVKPRWSGDKGWGAGLDIPKYVPEGEKLTFSHEAGIYSTRFSLTLSTGYTGGVIRYTTNGGDPAPDSAEYAAEIPIADRTKAQNYFSALRKEYGDPYSPPEDTVFKGNIIKAQVYSPEGVPLTAVYTKSYIIGAPFKGLPVISVAANEADLFDDKTGIFVNGNFHNRGAEWERPCHVELFEPDGSLGFAQYMGVRIHGGVSRNFPQKSLRFYTRSDYDPGKPSLEYDLFDGAGLALDGTPVNSYRRFLTRNFGNDGGAWGYMRDALVHRYSQGLNFAVQDVRYTVVLLNGEFWGLYEIRERIDEHFLNSKYKLGDTNTAILTNGWDSDGEFPEDTELYNEMVGWFDSNADLSDPKKYAQAQRFIDIDNLIDYFIVRSYANDLDWPANNSEMWRYQTEGGYPEEGAPLGAKDGRWRYILKDADQTYGLYGQNRAEDNQFTRLFDTTGDLKYHNGGDDFAAKPWATLFFRRLCTNPGFVDKFINRYCDLMNTHMKPSVVEAIVNEFAGLIEPHIAMQFGRWGAGQWWGQDANRWRGEVSIIKDFNKARPGHVIRHMTAQKELGLSGASPAALTLKTDRAKGHIRINAIDILPATPGVDNPARWSGNYFTGKTQTVTAVPARGCRFEKFIVDGAEHTENPLKITLSGATEVEAVFAAARPEELWENPFDDVSEDDWFYDAVAFVNANGLFAGYSGNSFAPLESMTRAMFVTVIYKIEGRPAPKGTASFTDLPEGTWYTDAVLWAAESGIVEGYGGGISGHDRPIARQEAAVMLSSYAAYKGYELPKNHEMPDYADAGAIDWWAEGAVKALSEAGVLVKKDAFRPKDNAARAELAEMFMYFMRLAADM